MPDALGQFGMNPLAALKQSMLDYIRETGGVTVDGLRATFHRDARSAEFMEALNDLTKTKHAVMTQTKTGSAMVTATIIKNSVEESMFKTLSE